jgi:Anticodon binding domain
MPSAGAKRSPHMSWRLWCNDDALNRVAVRDRIVCMPEEMPGITEVANPFTSQDVAKILRDRGWVTGDVTPTQIAWCEHAAAILGTQVADHIALADLLGLIFRYDPRAILENVESHAVLARFAARDVLRELALLLLDPAPLNSDRFKEIITALKEKLDTRGRELFHPIRLALAGRSGEGELDRVILLLDEAAALPFATRVKSARERILEFCATLD